MEYFSIDANKSHIFGIWRVQSKDYVADISSDETVQIDELLHDIVEGPHVSEDDSLQVAQGDHDNVHAHIRDVLLGAKRNILEDLLFQLLLSPTGDKWRSYELEELYDVTLSTTNAIYRHYTNHELDVLLKVLEQHQSKVCPMPKINKSLKAVKCNQIGKLFGHTDYLEGKRHKLGIGPLSALCKEEIRLNVPVAVLREAFQIWEFDLCYERWKRHSPIPLLFPVPNINKEFNAFSYPEFCEHRNNVEPRTTDPSHILTNLRLHCTQKKIFGCDPKAYMRVSEADNKILSRGLLVPPILDKQSVPFARRVFSQDVEKTMLTNGDIKESKLVHLIRNWYDACNERGIPLAKRLKYLYEMNDFLGKFYNPRYFPLNPSYVHGLPSTTFQCILQSCATRFQLYYLSEERKYNQRSVSTLAVENIFSSLSQLADNTSGIPLAAYIPRYISKMTQLNNIHDDPTKYV